MTPAASLTPNNNKVPSMHRWLRRGAVLIFVGGIAYCLFLMGNAIDGLAMREEVSLYGFLLGTTTSLALWLRSEAAKAYYTGRHIAPDSEGAIKFKKGVIGFFVCFAAVLLSVSTYVSVPGTDCVSRNTGWFCQIPRFGYESGAAAASTFGDARSPSAPATTPGTPPPTP